MKHVVNFLYELGILKRVRRSGCWLLDVEDPENVAEHSFRAAMIGYFLGKLSDNVNTEKVALMALFNDLHETRIGDVNKVGHRYLNVKEAETKAHKEQADSLGEIGKDIFSFHQEFQNQSTPEAVLARDADLLENALWAREMIKIGYEDAQNWLDNINKVIKTKIGKKMLKEIEVTDPNDWWKSLKKIKR